LSPVTPTRVYTYGSRKVAFDGELWIEREDFKLEADKKFFRLKLGSEVRLKGAYVVSAYDYVIENGEVVEILCTYDKMTKSGTPMDRKVKGTIHWVSRNHSVAKVVNEYDNLFNCESPEKEENIIDCVNKESLVVNDKAYFELAINDISIGESVQVIRKGYYCIDKNSINRTVSLKESWK